jgi:hypothetical protein
MAGGAVVLRIISLGAGVQSTTMALMAAHGEIEPMPDCAIFADTGWEPRAVYEHLRWLMSPNVLPFPVHVVAKGDLWKSATKVRRTRDEERSYIETAIPVYTLDGLERGIGRRACTRDFKIAPINQTIRRLAGLSRVTEKHGTIAEVWIGISADEAIRKKPNELPYVRSRWPLLERDMDRLDCEAWLADHSYPQPPRSACIFCPFRDDNSWLALADDERAAVAQKEREIQAAYEATTELRSVPFFHESRVPFDQVIFHPEPPKPRARQLNLFLNECEGMCGV